MIGTRIADPANRVAGDLGDVDVLGGRDLAGHDDQARRDERFAGDTALWVAGHHGVENPIRDLVGDLVGVPLGHRLRGKEVLGHLLHASGRDRRGTISTGHHAVAGRGANTTGTPTEIARLLDGDERLRRRLGPGSRPTNHALDRREVRLELLALGALERILSARRLKRLHGLDGLRDVQPHQ